MAEAKKRLKEFKPAKAMRAETKYPLRSVKLIRPICEECQVAGHGWWETCEHDPYHRLKPIVTRTEKKEVDPDTGLVTITGRETKVQKFVHTPNVEQAFLMLRINSGLGVDAALAKGFRFPQEVQPTRPTGEADPEFDGYAPMCEFQNCYKPNPTIKARHSSLSENRMVPPERQIAYYCTAQHAKLAKQRDTENVVREVYDPTKRREQLDAVALP